MITLEPVGQCIDGPGERTRLGYVRLWNGGNRILAHVDAWTRKNGPAPEGKELDHICNNRWCRNPDHLEPVTHKENCRRSAACKLDQGKADEIRRLRARGLTLREIGDVFGVTRQSIWLIVKGKQWK